MLVCPAVDMLDMALVDAGTRTTTGGSMSETAPARPRFSPRLLLRGMAWDVGLPLVAFYGLHLAGASDWVALLTASGAAAARLVWAAVRDRRLNPFAAVMLVVFGVGVALALIGGDPRFLLLKDSVTTAAIGLTFVVTTLFGRPLTFVAMQSFNPAKAQYLAQR